MSNSGDWLKHFIEMLLEKINSGQAIILALFLIIFSGIQKPSILHCSSNEKIYSRLDFERIQINDTITEVESVLGAGVKTKASQESEEYNWSNPGGSKIIAIFVGQKLSVKQQFGLE